MIQPLILEQQNLPGTKSKISMFCCKIPLQIIIFFQSRHTFVAEQTYWFRIGQSW